MEVELNLYNLRQVLDLVYNRHVVQDRILHLFPMGHHRIDLLLVLLAMNIDDQHLDHEWKLVVDLLVLIYQ